MLKAHPKNIDEENVSLTVYADNTYMDETQEKTVKDVIESMNSLLNLETDTDLKKSGMAADAKATGDAINTLSNNITESITNINAQINDMVDNDVYATPADILALFKNN